MDTLLKLGGKLFDRVFPDKQAAAEAKAALAAQIAAGDRDLLRIQKEFEQSVVESRASIIIAEQQGKSWLQRNWRACVMLTFAGVFVVHSLGWTDDALTTAEVMRMFDLLQIGVIGFATAEGVSRWTENRPATQEAKAKLMQAANGHHRKEKT